MWWLVIGFAIAVSPMRPGEAVAPGLDTLHRALVVLDQQLAQADATGTALIRTHNAVAGQLASGGSCTPQLRGLLAQAEPLGSAHRDRVQAARVGWQRIESLVQTPTLAGEPAALFDAVLQRYRTQVRDHVRHYLALRAWHHQVLRPARYRCAPRLQAHQGLGPTKQAPRQELAAILVLSPGKACPKGRHLGQGVYVVPGVACYGEGVCRCAPTEVFSAAVLGPPPPTPASAAAPDPSAVADP